MMLASNASRTRRDDKSLGYAASSRVNHLTSERVVTKAGAPSLRKSSLFACRRWSLWFEDQEGEDEFVVYFLQYRLTTVVFLICAVIIAAASAISLVFLDGLLIGLLVTSMGLWSLALVLTLFLWWRKYRNEPCCSSSSRSSHHDRLAQLTQGTTPSSHAHRKRSSTPSIDIFNGEAREAVRSNAKCQEAVNVGILVTAVVYSLALTRGRQSCLLRVSGASPKTASYLCIDAIQNEVLILSLLLLTQYLNHARVAMVWWVIVCLLLPAIIVLPWLMLPRTLVPTPMVGTKAMIFSIELAATLWNVWRRERAARAAFRAYVACHQHAAMLQVVQRKTEQLLLLQVPAVAAARAVDGGGGEARRALLWWSNEAVCGVVRIGGLNAWASSRSPLDVIQLLERPTVLFDEHLVKGVASWDLSATQPPSKYHSFGDAFVVAWYPSSQETTAKATADGPEPRHDLASTVDVVMSFVSQLLRSFVDIAEAVSTELLKEFSETDVAPPKQCTRRFIVYKLTQGPCGAYYCFATRNAVLIGPCE